MYGCVGHNCDTGFVKHQTQGCRSTCGVTTFIPASCPIFLSTILSVVSFRRTSAQPLLATSRASSGVQASRSAHVLYILAERYKVYLSLAIAFIVVNLRQHNCTTAGAECMMKVAMMMLAARVGRRVAFTRFGYALKLMRVGNCLRGSTPASVPFSP